MLPKERFTTKTTPYLDLVAQVVFYPKKLIYNIRCLYLIFKTLRLLKKPLRGLASGEAVHQCRRYIPAGTFIFWGM